MSFLQALTEEGANPLPDNLFQEKRDRARNHNALIVPVSHLFLRKTGEKRFSEN
jgi:hypothetical protein